MSRDFYSTDSEHGVLGALMLKPELCEEIGATLNAREFYHQDHQHLYGMILGLHSKGIKPDAISLSDMAPELPSGESTIYVAGMIQANIVSAANAKHYTKIIRDRALARKAYKSLRQVCEELQRPGDIHEQISAIHAALADLELPEHKADVYTYRDLLTEAVNRIDRGYTGTEERIGIDFGLPDLDDLLKDLRPGDLAILAGKPGTGKTVLATCLADRVGISGRGALVFSLEMPKEELVNRTLSAVAQIDKGLIDSGKLDDADWPKLTAAVNLLDSADVRICDRGGLTIGKICNIARFQHRAKKLSLVVIDYLTLIRSDPGSRHATRSAEIGSFTRTLKELAKELGVPVVTIAQLNRAMDSRADTRPRLTDLRDSGEIEQDADIVILGYRDDKSPEGKSGITEWDVPKNRHAALGSCRLQFQGQYQRFVSAAKSDAYAHERAQAQNPRKGKSMIENFQPGGFD